MSKHVLHGLMVLVVCGLVSSCATPKKAAVKEDVLTTEEPDIRAGTWESAPQVKTVYFDYNKATLRTDTKTMLKDNAAYFKENADLEILIEGHCDDRGTIEYNISLGQRRANTVRNYLSKLGLSLGKISTISYGEEQPVDYGHTESAWSKNRRAELKVRSIEAE